MFIYSCKNKIIFLLILAVLFINIFIFNILFVNSVNAAITKASTEVLGTMFQSKISDCQPADAGDVTGASSAMGGGGSITVFDKQTSSGVRKVVCQDQRNGVERALDQIKTWAIDEALVQLKKSGDIAWRQTLKFFLNTLAYDTATYLATGDKGQMPMFETEGWGGYLKNVADNTVGSFFENLGKNMGTLKFNLCSPNLDVMLKINLGLMRTYRPKAPACTFSKMIDNWDTALKDKDFLPKFQDMFNPWSNDLGIALTLQTGIESEISKKVNEAAQDRIEGAGWRPVRSAIEGRIMTPADVVGEQARLPIKDSTASEKIRTGTILADSIDIFINTLAGRLIDKWLKKGLVTNFPSKMSSLTDPNAQNQTEGVTGAENRFRSLTEPNFKVRGDYDILAELTMCPDPNKAGPTNCVIDEKFRQAIETRLTVGQALEQGYLNGNGIFGFTSDGLEPKFNEGYPYRSMLILRKFRILPVGWEIAAQKIKDQQAVVGGTKNLSDLVNCNQSWCAGLVDPNWVLKAPQNFCKREGAGPEIISEQVTGEGSGSSLSVLRNDNYCADEQSCIKEKSDGSCQLYGYCTEERRKWDFNAKSCEPRNNTCQTFRAPLTGSEQGGQTISYLENTLDYSNCNINNAGCQAYCADYDYTAGKFTCSGSSGSKIHLNNQADGCDKESQGCHEFIRILPNKDETYDDIKNDGLAKADERFGPTGLIYEKLLPDYLNNSCYDVNGKLKSNAPAECSDFVRHCSANQAGCELYTSISDGTKIPAKVTPKDYCPAECVGYNTFVQSQTIFDTSRDVYFIPKTAKTCNGSATGCDQFTNLDEVAKGGEGVEYYTYLRQCLKKSDNALSCAEFYNWEGSDESGYQLKVESLKVSGAEPAVTASDSALCTKDIYNLPPSNPAYNANCRQFYNRDGGISYHLYSRTISCSDDCHPYRKTVAVDDVAGSCGGGGAWDNVEKACIYMAIPGQGATCSASQNGCREYVGNTGNNVRNIFTDDFSGGTTDGWLGVNGSNVTPSSESLTLDSDNKGNSLKVDNSPFSAQRPVGNAVTSGKSYVLKFLAKAAAPTDLNLSLVNASGAKAGFAKVALSPAWQIFQTNLTDLNHEVAADEIILLEAGQNFYIDNIVLTEIVDRYYLIKNSWQTPVSCDSELNGSPHPLYMLGCGQYTDRANKTHYLKQFSSLCSESSVGCELMIDTQNSTNPAEEIFNKFGTAITVPADSFAYVVYDSNKLCNADAKGCQYLGKPYQYETSTLYGDVYLKNNPDKYNQILCGANAVGCQAYVYDLGESYFKDPGDMVCEWRQATGQGESQSWFKKKIKRCNGNGGQVCLTDADCAAGAKCQLETADNPCPTADDKTLGLGGIGSRVSQPGGGWAGICSASESGCGEYIDPISKFNTNIIFNGSFQDLDNNPNTNDGWGWGLIQDVVLDANTVYRLARDSNAGALRISNCSGADSLYELDKNNSLVGPKTSLEVPSGNNNSRIFYFSSNDKGSCKITVANTNGAVELKPVAIDYQLRQNLDRQGCNGIVNFDKGCVLFNERKQSGAGLAGLDWDADITVDGSGPASGADADKDSNVIIKVTPDRTCDKWLACKSYIKDEKGNNTCFNIGLCDAVDENGNCNSFIRSPKTNQVADTLGANKISNLSGYAKAGIAGGSLINDYYPLGAMEQTGELANLANGGFEFYGANGYPIGWTWGGQVAANKSWDANVFSVINNPISAQAEGVGYAREGRAFLKLGSSYDATSEEVDVIPNTDYIITAYANTKNLKSGQAKIDIVNGAGVAIKSGVITQNLGNDWQFEVGKFKTGANDSKIKIKLYSSAGGTAGSEGNFYFDDIKIRPALNSKDNWYTTQSCRLYPTTDSLSCDYYEDSGNRQKGWYGYCLEYDRAPGDPNACILWYPVDKVKGDGVEEGAGYLGKMPVYYCIDKVSIINVPSLPYNSQYSPGGKPTNVFWADQTAHGDLSGGFTVDYPKLVTPGGSYEIRNATGRGPKATILENNFDMLKISGGNDGCEGCFSEGTYSFDLYDSATNEKVFSWSGNIDIISNIIFTRVDAYCSKVAKTVTEVGQNKFWSSRVYQGSIYELPCGSYDLNNMNFSNGVCGYNSDFVPFGSINTSGLNMFNPYDWDDNQNVGIQPLSFLSIKNTPRTIKYYDQTMLKRLFAQSYGGWSWSGDGVDGRYAADNSLNWSLPNCLCGSGCDANFCAKVPTVFNVKINNSGSNVDLTKNGFINLTFNTKADSNQLPLVMYAVDWGDGESTTVTGVEMRDRPNTDVPHSLYHLYSYWDLKAKANSGVNSIDCSTAGECKVKPKIQIKDNWGWCNYSAVINICGAGQWDNFGGSVVVKEK